MDSVLLKKGIARNLRKNSHRASVVLPLCLIVGLAVKVENYLSVSCAVLKCDGRDGNYQMASSSDPWPEVAVCLVCVPASV